jgi:structural maintenance of chromosome 3 (chondroitin sulfate proteoglycan 6)
MLQDGTALSREAERLKERVAKLGRDIEDLESELAGAETKVRGYKIELASPMSAGLTGDEERSIETLGREVERRQKEMVELAKTRNAVGRN